MEIYLIRHAKTQDIAKGIVQGTDSKILRDGETLGKIEDLKSKLGEVDVVFCSPNTRTMETADLLFGKDNYEVVDYAYEYLHPKFLIGKSDQEKVKFWKEHEKDKYNVDWSFDGSESIRDISQRAKKLWQELMSFTPWSKKIVFVGNATFMRYLLCIKAEVDPEEKPKLAIDVLRVLPWDNLEVVKLKV